jgi:hypothetical protein
MPQLKDSTNKEKEDMIVLYQVKLFKKVIIPHIVSP